MMKIILFIFLTLISVNALSNEAKRVDVDTRCIGGYLFAVAVKTGGYNITTVSIYQIFKEGKFPDDQGSKYPPQPIKCKRK